MSGAKAPDLLHAVNVLPDLTGIDRTFTYLIPNEVAVTTGMIVRINLANRRVRAWIVDDHVDIPEGVTCKPIEGVVSLALDVDRIALAKFAGWRYAGRIRPFLLAGSPERIVRERDLPDPRSLVGTLSEELDQTDPVGIATRDLMASGGGVLQLPPTAQRLSVVRSALEMLERGDQQGKDLLVLVPERRDVETLARRLRRLGVRCATLPEDFGSAFVGGVVVIGTRNAVFGPVGSLGAIVVLDAQSESYVDQRAPTWNATVIAQERARLAGAICILTSPAPPLAITAESRVRQLERPYERAHWPALEVLDRRSDDPRSGLYSPMLGEIVHLALERDDRPVACILNRTGRLRLLACRSCGEVARCEHCDGAMRQLEGAGSEVSPVLTCSRCAKTRPLICTFCHSGQLKVLRVGATRAAEELSALLGLPTKLVTGDRESTDRAQQDEIDARVIVGTEAILHRQSSASLVVFLDFDQHLFAPRFGAAEESLSILALAGRLVGPRGSHSVGAFARRLVVQTRLPEHEVVVAAREGDPSKINATELVRRRELNLPPSSAIALISGEEAAAFIELLAGDPSIEVGLFDDVPNTPKRQGSIRYLVRAMSTRLLCEALSAREGFGAGLRIEVDPSSI